MENIRLPEDFTDRVMRRIEHEEKIRAGRQNILSTAGYISGGAAAIAIAILVLHHYRIDILAPISSLLSDIPAFLSSFQSISGSLGASIFLAIFALACISLMHDHRQKRDRSRIFPDTH